MKKIRVAVIGCGRISQMHLVPISLLKNVELVCVCDIKENRAKQTSQQYNVKYYLDYRQMMQQEHLDAVHICTPHYLHTEMCKYAFLNNINVICEKPMSISYEDALKTVKLAEKCNLLYCVVFQCRYNKASIFAKKIIDGGSVGKIKAVKSSLTWSKADYYYSTSDWKGTWEKEGGGVVIDQAIHSIDLVNWLVNDEIIKIQASIANRCHKTAEVEDTAEGLITYKSGIKYFFYAMNNFYSNEPIEICLICENGKIIFNYDMCKVFYNDGRTKKLHKQKEIVLYNGQERYWGFAHIRQIKQFYNSLLNKESLENSGREALKIQKIIDDIYSYSKRSNDDNNKRQDCFKK